jgi:2,4-dichlorophenol 6-monooxygenase
MEVMRDLGLESDVIEKATPQQVMGNIVFCESLALEEFGRIRAWGTDPARQGDYDLASPCKMCDMPQDLLEPILVNAASQRGANLYFDWKYLSLTQDGNGVTVDVKDQVTGINQKIYAKYVIGADGAHSKIAEDIALPMEGKMGVAGSIFIVFEADLARYVVDRPSVLYFILQPGSDIGGIGLGLIRMVRPWYKWAVLWGYDINKPPPLVTNEMAIEIVQNLVGDHTIPIKIESITIGKINDMYARRNTVGRVFCVGDATHRHPPNNGLGSNTAIQDSYNLAWKLALVLRGLAAPTLLETYNEERSPVARQVVKRSTQSIGEYGQIFDALGLVTTQDEKRMKEKIDKLKDNDLAAEDLREKLYLAIHNKSYEYNCHGVELNQRYVSMAIVSDGTAEPEWKRDKELYYQASTRPGAKLPHIWLQQGEKKVSSLDLCGKGKFTLITGIGGETWVEAAKKVAAQTGVDIQAFVIGPGRDFQDIYNDWANQREIREAGCILVRPDGYICFRHFNPTAIEMAVEFVSGAMAQILGVRKG